jgi:hypothetical protein
MDDANAPCPWVLSGVVIPAIAQRASRPSPEPTPNFSNSVGQREVSRHGIFQALGQRGLAGLGAKYPGSGRAGLGEADVLPGHVFEWMTERTDLEDWAICVNLDEIAEVAGLQESILKERGILLRDDS